VTATAAPEPAPAEGRQRNLRGAILGTVGILLALALAWFVGAVAVPFFQVRAVVREFGGRPSNVAAPYIERLGGPERAAARLALFAGLPGWATSSRDRHYAASLLGCTNQWDLACEVYRTTHHADVKEALFSWVLEPLRARIAAATKEDIFNRYGRPDYVSQDGSGWEYYGTGERYFLGFDGDGKLKSVYCMVSGR